MVFTPFQDAPPSASIALVRKKPWEIDNQFWRELLNDANYGGNENFTNRSKLVSDYFPLAVDRSFNEGFSFRYWHNYDWCSFTCLKPIEASNIYFLRQVCDAYCLEAVVNSLSMFASSSNHLCMVCSDKISLHVYMWPRSVRTWVFRQVEHYRFRYSFFGATNTDAYKVAILTPSNDSVCQCTSDSHRLQRSDSPSHGQLIAYPT
jgi:hypothetical protein